MRLAAQMPVTTRMKSKTCIKCGEKKELVEFHKHKRMDDGHLNKCKSCTIEYIKQWADQNKHKTTEYKKRWKEINKEFVLEDRKRYARDNAGYINAKTARRRAGKLQATPKWANHFLINEIYHLAKLRSQMTNIKWEVDHIIPLNSDKVCGLHVEYNLQVIPAKLNQSKGNKFVGDY